LIKFHGNFPFFIDDYIGHCSSYITNIVNIKSLIYWQKGKIRDIYREKMENKMEDIHNKFIQEKNRGVAMKELCSHFHISKSTVYNRIKMHSAIDDFAE